MSKFFLILLAFALIVSVTVCVSHSAHAGVNAGFEISISIDADSPDDTSLSSDGCDMFCGGCCVHHVIHTSHGISTLASGGKGQLLMPDTNILVSDFIYGLKRPPKS